MSRYESAHQSGLGPRLLLLLGLSLVALTGRAHDLPASVTVDMYVKPQPDSLHVVVRVPMEALAEIDFPTRGPGYLEFSQLQPALNAAARTYIIDKLSFEQAGEPLPAPQLRAARVDLPADRSFTDYQRALANVQSPPLGEEVELLWSQGVLDVWLVYPLEGDMADLSLQSKLAQLGEETQTLLRYVAPEGEQRNYHYRGSPGVLALDPGWWRALSGFTRLGAEHILGGLDHLLFLLCLIIPLRRLGQLIPIVTAFTIAHSITLLGAAFGLAPSAGWFAPLIETLIALSVVYMACENIVGRSFEHRWLLAFGFGLVHGFGFSFLLADSLQFAGDHLLTALLAFNLGVELGQLAVLVLVVPLLALAFRHLWAERVGVILLSALVLHEAWHWMTARAGDLRQFEFQWPAVDMQFWLGVMHWTMLLIVAALAAGCLGWLFNRLASPPPAEE